MSKNHKPSRPENDGHRGYSALELLVVMMVSLIIAALTIPNFNQIRRNLRISGDARDLNGAINQAKLQAAADFTWARVYGDFTNPRLSTFHVEVWNKALNGGAGCWQTVGDPIAAAPFVRCTVAGTSPVQTMSDQVTFGFGGAGAPPPNTQTNGIAQASPCQNIAGGNGTTANTGCIVFNSRGMPINWGNGTPTPDDAFYITDNTVVYGMTVGPTGISQIWAAQANGGTGGSWYHK